MKAPPPTVAIGYYLAGLLVPVYIRLVAYTTGVIIPFTRPSLPVMAIAVVATLACLLVHELVHMISARLLGVRARITTLLRYGALQLEYLDPMNASTIALVLASPLAILQPLLLAAVHLLHIVHAHWLAGALAVAAVMHLVGSILDAVNIVYVVGFRRRCVFTLMREAGRVVGWCEDCQGTVHCRRLGSPLLLLLLLLAGLACSIPLSQVIGY